MDEDDSVIKYISYYQQGLDKHTKRGNDEKVLYYLGKLNKLPIQLSHLETTGIGRIVNNLRKNGGQVGETCKQLVYKWKKMVDEQCKEREEEYEPESTKSHDSSQYTYVPSTQTDPSSMYEPSSYKKHRYEDNENAYNYGDNEYDQNAADDDSENGELAINEDHVGSEEEDPPPPPPHSDSDEEEKEIKKSSSSKSEKQHRHHHTHHKHKKEKKTHEEKHEKHKSSSASSSSSKKSSHKDKHRDKETKSKDKVPHKGEKPGRKENELLKAEKNKHIEDTSSIIDKKSTKKYEAKEEKEKSSKSMKSNKHASESEKHSKSKSEKHNKVCDMEKPSTSKSKHESRKENIDKKDNIAKPSKKSKNEERSKKRHRETDDNHYSKKSKKPKNDADSDEGETFNNESGASFAEIMGMMDMDKVKKKSSPAKTKPSKPESLESPLKLKPLDPNLASSFIQVPEITTNYKPLGYNPTTDMMNRMNGKFKSISDDDALHFQITSKKDRCKVYSGTKSGYGKVMSLFEMCILVLQDHIDDLEYTGGVPFSILKPILERATPNQLDRLEYFNPYLVEETGDLWEYHCRKQFPKEKREEFESWKELYIRCVTTREAKLKTLTANIKQAMDKSVPVRQTKLAYVDTAVKPPRSIARKQAKFGTQGPTAVTPMARLSGPAGTAAAKATPAASSRSTPVSAPASAPVKPKKAPLMQKTIALMKNRFKR